MALCQRFGLFALCTVFKDVIDNKHNMLLVWINVEKNLPGSSAAWRWLFCRQGFENYSILCASQIVFGGKRTKKQFFPLSILTHLAHVSRYF